MATFVKDGSVELYHDNVKKFETDANGATITGRLFLGDSSGANDNRIRLGADGDLSLYHDGSNSYVQDNGTGELRLASTNGNSVRITKGDSETLANFNTDGACELFYDNVKKVDTTSYGSRTTGYHTQSAPVSWMAYADSQWYNINAGNTIDPFNFNNIAHNIGSHYKNSGTDAGKFVAPVSGVYQLNWNIFCACTTNQTSAATLEMYAKINNNIVSRLHNKAGYGNVGDDQQVMNICVTEQLSAGDKVHIRFAAYSANWQIYGGHTSFSGHLVG